MAKKKKRKKPDPPSVDPEDRVQAAAWSLDAAPSTTRPKRQRRDEDYGPKVPATTGTDARKRERNGLKPGASLSELAMINKKKKNLKKQSGGKSNVRAAPVQDLWEDQEQCPGLVDNDWLGQTKMPRKYSDKVSKKTGPERSRAPAVEVAAAGASVVPTEEDRQRLVNLAAAHELQKDEARHVAKQARTLATRKAQAEGQLPLTHAEDDDMGLETIEPIFNEPVVNKKLTKAQRNKRERHKALVQQQAASKASRKGAAQFTQIDVIHKQILSEEKEQEQKASDKSVSAEEKLKFYPRKLSRHSFEQPRPEVLLAEEVGSGLRSTNKEGSLLKDRFKSLQKRNMLSVGAKQRAGHGKHKLKVKTRTTINKNGTTLNGLKDW